VRRPLAWLAVAALVAAAVGWAVGGRPGGGPQGPTEPLLGPYPLSQFHLERDRFLPANEPATVPAPRAAFLRDDDEVFGVVLGGQARAYPVPMLSYHHVVNDVVRGIPVAVTY
jgi:hypothetical protein